MDRVEKLALTLSIILVFIFFVGVLVASTGFGIKVPTCITNVPPYNEAKVIKHDDKHYEIHYIAKMWMFEPNEVKIPAGSVVDIYLVSSDVQHGFHIAEKNVNLMAVPGTINYARVKFDKPGEYHIVCHEYCGVGHEAMRAKIIVE